MSELTFFEQILAMMVYNKAVIVNQNYNPAYGNTYVYHHGTSAKIYAVDAFKTGNRETLEVALNSLYLSIRGSNITNLLQGVSDLGRKKKT